MQSATPEPESSQSRRAARPPAARARPEESQHSDGAGGTAPAVVESITSAGAATHAAPDAVATQTAGETTAVPSDAVPLDAATGLRAWAGADRGTRGVVGEAGATPGRLIVRLSRPCDTPRTFRLSCDPPGAIRLPGDGRVTVAAGQTTAVVRYSALVPGPAAIVLDAVADGVADAESGAQAGAATGVVTARIRAPVDLRSSDEFPEPVLLVRTVPPGDDGAGGCLCGSEALRAPSGGLAGSIRVARSRFRGFDSVPTDVLVGADDPDAILAPLPSSVTIPAGATEHPQALPVRLTGRAGRATVRLRHGATEVAVVVDSVEPSWEIPDVVRVAPGARRTVTVGLRPETRSAPRVTVTADETVAGVRARPAARGSREWRVPIDVEGRAVGEHSVRVSAPGFGERVLRVIVAAEEVPDAAR